MVGLRDVQSEYPYSLLNWIELRSTEMLLRGRGSARVPITLLSLEMWKPEVTMAILSFKPFPQKLAHPLASELYWWHWLLVTASNMRLKYAAWRLN